MSTARYGVPQSVPGMVGRALDRSFDSRVRITAADPAERLGRMAELYERDARWWSVLARWFQSEAAYESYLTFGPAFQVFHLATLSARDEARRSAEDYRELAASARERAARTAVAA